MILPREAPYQAETSPNCSDSLTPGYGKRIDALTQLIARVRTRQQVPLDTHAGPELVGFDDYTRERFPQGMTGILTRHGFDDQSFPELVRRL